MFNVSFTTKGIFRILLVYSLLLFVRIQANAQDTDGDGTANATDLDDDNDGLTDDQEAFLLLSNYQPPCGQASMLDFSAPATLESGTAKTAGAVYRIANVLAGTDALIQIELLQNITDIIIDDNTTGRVASFQPSTTVNNLPLNQEAFTQYKITFVAAGTATPVKIGSLFANIADIDGNAGSIGDVVYFSGHASYTYQQPSTMTVINSVYNANVNWTKFTAATVEINSVDTLNKAVMVTPKFAHVSSFRIRVGVTSRQTNGGGITRGSRFDFTCMVRYTTPSTYVIDFDEDGLVNTLDLDSDNDGIADVTETFAAKTDTDVNPDFLDTDADADGISDLIEAQATATFKPLTNLDDDQDGMDNAFDDKVGFGLTVLPVPVNTEGLDTPDYIDLDSDNDAKTDALEGWDTDHNGVANTIPAGTDGDRDGLDDAYDVNDVSVNPGNGQTPLSFPNFAGTSERDWREPYIDKPTANPDKLAATEDVVLTFNPVFLNDISSDDGPSATAPFTITGQPLHGAVTIDNNGTPADPTDDKYLFTPAPNYNGPDSFIYQICDLTNDCDTALVTIGIAAVNDRPVTADELASTDPAVAVTVNVGSNDTDVDAGTVFTFKIVSNPPGSTATINAQTGILTYTPTSNNNRRQDTIVYSVCDNGTPQLCANGRMIVTVPNIIITLEDTPALIKVSNTASNPSSLVILNNPKNGTAKVNTTTGEITYTPNLNYNGLDSLRYKICGKTTPCDSSWILISVSAVNDPPVVDTDLLTINEDTPGSGDLTNAGDSDVEGTALTATEVTQKPKHGTLSVNQDGTFNYTPALNFNGKDTAVVKICDAGLPLPAMCVNNAVFISITPVNDAPVASNVLSNADPAVVTKIALAGHSTDPDTGTVFIYSLVTNPPGTSALINTSTGELTYTSLPDPSTRTDIVNYKVCDNAVPSLCSSANVLIAIPDRSFRAKNDVAEMEEDKNVIVYVLVNDTAFHPVDTSKLAIAVQPKHGKVMVDYTHGTLVYTPDANYYGSDSLTYSICTAAQPSECKTAMVAFAVSPVNDLEVLRDQFVAGIGDAPVQGNFIANDTDPENTGISAGTLLKGADSGEFSFLANGDFTYAPFASAPSTTEIVVVEVCDKGFPLPGICKNDTIYFAIKQYLFISEGFTPNGDGQNDNFIVETLIPGNIDLKMFNRWGGLVYANTNYHNEWDGRSNQGIKVGEVLPEGTYFYEIKFGNNAVKRSYITIIK